MSNNTLNLEILEDITRLLEIHQLNYVEAGCYLIALFCKISAYQGLNPNSFDLILDEIKKEYRNEWKPTHETS